MNTKAILGLLYFIAFSNASRVIYMIMHAEKPGNGNLNKGQRWSSTQNIPGEYENGLSYTGYERSKCLVNIFGKSAPSYRQPKEIIYQHYDKQGDFIDSGDRGKHNSRRMYETAALVAEDLGINLDEEKCCGGDPGDMFAYIEKLDESINPILIVHQHQQIYAIAKKYAKKFGKTLPYTEFKYDSSTIWTLVDGEIVEDWGMNCYFDQKKKNERLASNIEDYLVGATARNTTLLQEETPLITTKVVPASLLTTITSKVPPNGAGGKATAVPASTTKALEGSTTFKIGIKATPAASLDGQTTTKTTKTKTVPDVNHQDTEGLENDKKDDEEAPAVVVPTPNDNTADNGDNNDAEEDDSWNIWQNGNNNIFGINNNKNNNNKNNNNVNIANGNDLQQIIQDEIDEGISMIFGGDDDSEGQWWNPFSWGKSNSNKNNGMKKMELEAFDHGNNNQKDNMDSFWGNTQHNWFDDFKKFFHF